MDDKVKEEEPTTENLGIDINSIPSLVVQNPTPSPHLLSSQRESEKETGRQENGEGDDDDDDIDDDEEEDDDDDDVEMGEEEAEEEEDPEMTQEEKQAMYQAVTRGDIDGLEDCLELPNADINMTWFQENLLMAAIRVGQTEMAEFLIDNGVDHTYRTSRMRVRETADGCKAFDRYEIDCRQMAFDNDLEDLVYLMDHLQGRLFPFVPAPNRSPRMRRPPPITPITEFNSDDGDSSDADVSEMMSSKEKDEIEGLELNESMDDQTSAGRTTKHRKKRKSKNRLDSAHQLDSEANDEYDRDKTARTGSTGTFGERDSGNYSMASSSRLKKNLVEKHNQLYEQNEKADTDGVDNDGNDNDRPAMNAPKSHSNNNSMSGSRKSRRKENPGHEQEKADNNENENDEDQNNEEKEDSEETTLSESFRSKKSLHVSDWTPEMIEAFHPPATPMRYDRSAHSIYRSKTLGKFYTSPLHETNQGTPLQWRKVRTPGSYAVESKRWHRETHQSTFITAPSSCPDDRDTSNRQNKTTTSVQHGKNSTLRSSLVTPSSISSSSTTSSLSSKSSMSLISDSSTVKSHPNPILKSSIKSSSPSSSSVHKQHDTTVLKSENPAVAGYMRPTKSTVTKQRLTPCFVDSYGGLSFQARSAKSAKSSLNSLRCSIQNIDSSRRLPDRPSTVSPSFIIPSAIPNTGKFMGSQKRSFRAISHRV